MDLFNYGLFNRIRVVCGESVVIRAPLKVTGSTLNVE